MNGSLPFGFRRGLEYDAVFASVMKLTSESKTVKICVETILRVYYTVRLKVESALRTEWEGSFT